MRVPHRALLGLLLVLAVLVRRGPASESLLLDDPDSCAHLRRIELGLASERAADGGGESDGFVAHPSGAEWSWLPLYDTLLAGFAARFLPRSDGEPELAGVPEVRLERAALILPPLLGVLAVLATWLLARELARGEWRSEAALWAAALVALSPVASGPSSAGRLDHGALLVALGALALLGCARALEARGLRETIVAALPAGALLGLACATSLLGMTLFLAAWLAFLVHVARSAPEQRREVQRTGLLVCFVAVFAAQLPLPPDPERAGAASLIGRLHEAALGFVMLATVPFLVGFFLGGERQRRFLRSASLVVAMLLIVYSFPRFVHTLSEAWQRLGDARATLACVDPGWRALWEQDAGARMNLMYGWLPLLVLSPWMVLQLVRQRRDPLAWLVLVAALATSGLALVMARAAVLSLVALAAAAAWCFARTERVQLLRGALAAALLLAALGAARPWLAPASELRAVRAEIVQGLRWLRAERGPSPRWNVPGAVGEEGALSSPVWGPAIVYHARRPVAASLHAAFSDPSSLAEAAHALLGADPEALLHYARATQLRYVIVGPTLLAEAEQLEQLADAHAAGRARVPIEQSLVARLALDPSVPESGDLPGLRRLYASSLRCTPEGRAPRAGEPAGPALSIYECEPGAVGPRPAELSPR